MFRNHNIIPRLLVGILLLAALTGCESKQELETRMAEISGDYYLSSVNRTDAKKVFTEEELAIVSDARVFPHGNEWIFEATIPFPDFDKSSPGSKYDYRQLRKSLIWDQEFGAYFFYRFSDDELPDYFDPTLARLLVENNHITFFYKNNYQYVWYKK